MSREIKAPEVVLSTEKSFDGKHEIQFNEKSHRYKWTCDCHAKAASVGVTTFIKSSFPTSVGLTNWMKSQSVEALFRTVAKESTTPGTYIPNETVWPITVEKKKKILKAATVAHEEVAQEAADIGTITHAYAELYSLKQFDEAEALLDRVRGVAKWPVIESCIKLYRDWVKKEPGDLVLSEQLIASPTHLFCGTEDRLDCVNGRLRLRDYKTSKDIYIDQFVQLAAYRIALKEWKNLDVDELEVVRFGKEDGAFDTLLINDPAEIQVFTDQAIRCRKTYDFMKLNNDPRFDWKKR